MVAESHLIGEAAEVPLELGEAARELVAPLDELGRRPGAARRRHDGGGRSGGTTEAARATHPHPIVCAPEPPPGALWSFGGALPGSTMVLGFLFSCCS